MFCLHLKCLLPNISWKWFLTPWKPSQPIVKWRVAAIFIDSILQFSTILVYLSDNEFKWKLCQVTNIGCIWPCVHCTSNVSRDLSSYSYLNIAYCYTHFEDSLKNHIANLTSCFIMEIWKQTKVKRENILCLHSGYEGYITTSKSWNSENKKKNKQLCDAVL